MNNNDKFKGLAEAIEKCERELPDGYSINMHSGEGGPTLVELFHGEERVWSSKSYPELSIAEKYLIALQWARDSESERKGDGEFN